MVEKTSSTNYFYNCDPASGVNLLFAKEIESDPFNFPPTWSEGDFFLSYFIKVSRKKIKSQRKIKSKDGKRRKRVPEPVVENGVNLNLKEASHFLLANEILLRNSC